MSRSLSRPVSERGQVTIPKQVRKDLKIGHDDQVVFIKVDEDSYLVKKIDTEQLKQFLLIDKKVPYDASEDK